MDSSRQTTVLFADVSGSTKLYETSGDVVALAAIDGAMAQLKAVTATAGGRVVKTIGDEIMAIFPSADSAATAAAAMHTIMATLPAVEGVRLTLRIGFQCGPVIQKDDDVFGDTVNLAARLVKQAVQEQTITSAETVGLLSPSHGPFIRRLYAIQVKGKAEDIELCELAWRQDLEATQLLSRTMLLRTRPGLGGAIKLVCRGREAVLKSASDNVTLGRDPDAGLLVPEENASRRHCTIERRGDKFVLKDHSSNGSYVTIEGGNELILRREELTLHKRGWIACGTPRSQAKAVVEFTCEAG
jgi:adenylate cyclase